MRDDCHGELALWAACMHEGIRGAMRSRKSRNTRRTNHGRASGDEEERGYTQDERWFWSDRVYVGSFVWLCHLFSIDPSQCRSRALMNARELAKQSDCADSTDEV